jgi:hypothetical protein
MLNSQNYVQDKEIIRSGEVVASTMPNKPGAKTYYHQVAGACTYMSDGAQLVFSGGQYSSDNKDIIKYLDSIVDRVGTLVYSRKPGSPISKEAVDLAMEVAEPAGNAASNVGTVHATPQATSALVNQAVANKPTAMQAVDPKLVDTK